VQLVHLMLFSHHIIDIIRIIARVVALRLDVSS